jgi:hypothetical protein
MLCAQCSLILLSRNFPVERGEYPVDRDVYTSPNQNAVSSRAVQLKNVVSLRHISVRYTR